MSCPNCPGQVPVISLALANEILDRIPKERRDTILRATFDWLCEKHPGLTFYEGINGRGYTDEEKDAIGLEHGVVAELPCPYHHNDACLIGGLGPKYMEAQEVGKSPYGWLPTLVAMSWGKSAFKHLVIGREIADAKVSLLTRNTYFYSRSLLGIG